MLELPSDSVLVVVARLEGSFNTSMADVKGSLRELTGDVKSVGDEIKDLKDRVGSLESWRNRLAGALGVILFIVALMGSFIITHTHFSLQ